MNANYSEALEQQVGLIKMLEVLPFEEVSRLTLTLMKRCLNEASTIHVSAALCPFLEYASRTYPRLPLLLESMPLEGGFMYFENSLPCRVPTLKVGREIAGLRAISWMPYDDEQHDAVFFTAWRDVSGRHLPWPMSVFVWRLGDTWSDMRSPFSEDTAEVVQMMVNIRRLFQSIAEFIQQRILVTSSHLAERHTRKRLERAGWDREHLIRVVELRRKEHRSVHSVEPTQREWACQWMVRGHWRQQPYPKSGEVRPLWITPYVKGPEDKPLKQPRATVFSVVR